MRCVALCLCTRRSRIPLGCYLLDIFVLFALVVAHITAQYFENLSAVSFGLPIFLRVMGAREIVCNLHLHADPTEEFLGKLRAVICDH